MNGNDASLIRAASVALGSLIVLGLGSLAVAGVRQPVRRVRIILLALAGAAIVPLVGGLPIAPRWSFAILPSASSAAPAEPVETASPGEARPIEVTSLDRAVEARGKAARAHSPARPIAEHGVLARSETTPASRPWPVPSVGTIAAFVYVLAAVAMAGWWLMGQWAFLRVVRGSSPAPEWVRELFVEIAGPTSDSVRLLASDRVALPFTNTWIRPVILLPESFCDRSEVEALRYALAHEWSHVERRDAWGWDLAALAGLALFYQPLFWWLRRQLRLGQDYLADARAAEVGSAENYAAFLVRLARATKPGPAWPALGIGGRRSNLHRRVVMLIQGQHLERRCRPAWSLAVAAAFVVIVVAASGLRLDAAPLAKGDHSAQGQAKEAGETLHYKGIVKDKDTGKPIAGATVVVRRSVNSSLESRVLEESHHTTAVDGTYEFTVPPDQAAERLLYIELDVTHPEYATRAGFGYSLGMTRKNEKLGERPFFESIELRPAKPVTGKVETPEGKPAVNVELLAYSRISKLPQGQFEYGSFARTKTAEDGSFRLPITTPGDGIVWILPTDFAPEMHVLGEGQRGDLGTFRLKPGIRLSGRALDADGKPKAGMLVEVDRDRNEGPQAEALNHLIVSDAIQRVAETDAEGRFQVDPLPPGTYTVKPTDFDSRADRSAGWKRREAPGPFPWAKVVLKEGETPGQVEIRERPSVLVEGHWIDSQGRPKTGWSGTLFGKLGGEPWFDQTRVDAQGHFSVKVPRGLTDARLEVMLNEHAAARHRIRKDAPLREGRSMWLGTLDRDVKEIEIVRYVAPVLVINATTKDGKQVDGFQAAVTYLGGDGKSERQIGLSGGKKKSPEVIQDEQNDGRYRTSQMLPDREVKVAVWADHFKQFERTVKLPEGAVEEVNLVLEPE
ncbi:M56 family metallopeptidase [Aquisphaera insulae]|uniref:M56 family metallopeptidase n=1 Tax=Aquisphaera insulae TaxID=2712864 RepID=UPI0013ED6DF5|nr:M56 family metallopeptidase [Aquisphaera insulae]